MFQGADMEQQKQDAFRALREEERQLLARLLVFECANVLRWRSELSSSRVRTIDDYGSLEFYVAIDKPIVSRSTPIEAEYRDADGVPVSILIHTIDGSLAELEIVKADLGILSLRPEKADFVPTIQPSELAK